MLCNNKLQTGTKFYVTLSSPLLSTMPLANEEEAHCHCAHRFVVHSPIFQLSNDIVMRCPSAKLQNALLDEQFAVLSRQGMQCILL